jgi:hypothetical protein
MEKILYHQQARYPLLWVQTTEEDRLIRSCRSAFPEDTQIFSWDLAAGLQTMVRVNGSGWKFATVDEKANVPEKAFPLVRGLPPESLIFMKDFHVYFEKIGIIRQALNLKDDLKANGKTIVFVSALKKIPPELKDDITVIDFEYPDMEYLKKIIRKASADNEVDVPTLDEQEILANALRGLTHEAAENALALTLCMNKKFDPKLLMDQKAAQIGNDGVLAYGKFKESFEDLYGMERAKYFLTKTVPHPKSRGSIFYGVPGAGKSHIIKATANHFKVPCLVLNFGNIRDRYQGVAEARLDAAFKTIRAFGNVIVICDEIDKALIGSEGGANTDGGVGARIFGELLRELEDQHGQGAKWFATCNNLEPILTMSGGALQRRFDALWFVDLPTQEEAKGIAQIWSKKEGVEIPEDFDFSGFSGADIAKLAEQMSMLECSAEEAAEYVIPYGKANAQELERIRAQAKGVCLWANPQPDKTSSVVPMRKVRKR